MAGITTHVLDIALGKPAEGVHVCLEVEHAHDQWLRLGHGHTDADGRQRTLMPDGLALLKSHYRLVFATGAYFETQSRETFFPSVIISFSVTDPSAHHHVPLLLSPFGYSTYRGS
ncbi:MAG: hydroxyisourate hydrolase [Polyangiales bacterium]